jgi:polyphosphate:AMP phosphotransferase
MFESANLSHKVDKAAFEAERDALRAALLDAQFEFEQARRFPVLILIAGVEGAGKGETVNLLNEWLDPRHIRTTAFGPPTDDESQRPAHWRFWQALPGKGRIGIFFGAWHTLPIVQRVTGSLGDQAYDDAVGEIQRLEKMLCDEGVLLVKFWFHLSKPQQRRRLKALEKDPGTRWRVSERDWSYFRLYDRFVEVCEPFLRQTSTAEAPWIVVPAADPRHRALAVGRHLLQVLRARLDADAAAAAGAPAAPATRPARRRAAAAAARPVAAPDPVNVLSALQLSQPMARDDYRRQLAKWQARLAEASRDPRFAQRAVVAVFEGNDGAGKGGAIRRVTQALDARFVEVVPIAAPTEEERAQPYLWRFWRHLPRRGRVVLFDRSWYGRVLVERVEGLCREADWRRAYGEIDDFEQALHRHGIVLVKFWLAISPDEQLRRFQERECVAFKRFKITAEDWRNRDKWPAYEQAVCEMVDRTSTAVAPWTLVEADNKLYARVKVLKTLCRAVESALQAGGGAPAPGSRRKGRDR